MFRQRENEDMSDEEFIEFEMPHIKLCSNYIEEFLIPHYVAFYISSGYYHNILMESSFKQHFNSAIDIFNHTISNKNNVIEKVKKIMKIIYSLEIIDEEPILKVQEI